MIVYLDGENVVHQIMDVLRRTRRVQTRDDLLGIDLVDLIHQMVGPEEFKIKYYATTLQVVKADPDLEKRSREMIAWTAQWVNHLIDQNIEVIKAGKLKAREGVVCRNCGHQEAIFQEKGVDVRLAVDLLVDAEVDKTAVVWSSDADLLPAIQLLKKGGSRVKNLAHKNAINMGLARQCGEWQTYSDGQIIKLFDKVNEKTDGN